MQSKGLIGLAGLLLAVVGGYFALPIFLSGTQVCTIDRAVAQEDSPCLVQQATISAQEVEILRMQLTSNAIESNWLGVQATNQSLVATIRSHPVAPVIITVPVLITATTNPDFEPAVTVVTATPLAGLDSYWSNVADSVKATLTALPEGCIPHVLAEGEFPGLVAEMYGVSVFDLMEFNGLDEETVQFLNIGDVLIIPTPFCNPLPDALPETTLQTSGRSANQEIVLPPTIVNAQVEIGSIISPGDISAEGIEIRNIGGVIDLTGWTIENLTDNSVYTFPTLQLFTNGLVTVYSRRGTNTPIVLYWGRSEPAWSSGDVIVLRDTDGNIQSAVNVS